MKFSFSNSQEFENEDGSKLGFCQAALKNAVFCCRIKKLKIFAGWSNGSLVRL